MKKRLFGLFLGILVCAVILSAQEGAWIRINQLGYTPFGIKVAVWCSKENGKLVDFELVDDRDHMSMRIPKEDLYYGKGLMNF